MDLKYLIPTALCALVAVFAWALWLYQDHRIAYPEDGRITALGYASLSLAVIVMFFAAVWAFGWAVEQLGVASALGVVR
jgi:MFS superfamily sulfate permease-like transporter